MRMNGKIILLASAAATAAMVGISAPVHAEGATSHAPYRSTACEKAKEMERMAAAFMGDPAPGQLDCRCTDSGVAGSDTRWSCTATDADAGDR